MTDSIKKLTHKEWRKEAKKFRRKKIRQSLAEIRKAKEKKRENSPTYLIQVERQRLLEEYELEKELKESEENNKKWLEEEVRAQKKFREDQILKALALEEKMKEQERIRQQWEDEQKKIRELKEKLEKQKKEEEKRKMEIIEKINDFMCNGGDIPEELRVITESNPEKELCSFYSKVGACRFGGQCSRNHQYYKISNTLLFPNFYTHFTLDQSKTSEYDTDISLEYEDSDMYSHFREFYNDIIPEFKKFGEVTMVKVCCNKESHLRGNVYVEYKNEREALLAYKSFQGRWYGGKQLNIEFVKIIDWGSAVCGDFARKRCPKGNSCNFLHIFKNPKNEFPIDWTKNKTGSVVRNNEGSIRFRDRSWRWSETPEPSMERIKEKYSNGKRRSRSRNKETKKKRSRSKSSERHRSKHKSKRSHSRDNSRRKKN